MNPQTCIIDWESTTTRPLWAAAHVPSFLQSSPFTAKLFRATVERLAHEARTVTVRGRPADLGALAADWLAHETAGARLRMAHRCVEWDGWEEGLVESILGPEEQEEDWFKSWDEAKAEAEGSATVRAWPAAHMVGGGGKEGKEGKEGKGGRRERRGKGDEEKGREGKEKKRE